MFYTVYNKDTIRYNKEERKAKLLSFILSLKHIRYYKLFIKKTKNSLKNIFNSRRKKTK